MWCRSRVRVVVDLAMLGTRCRSIWRMWWMGRRLRWSWMIRILGCSCCRGTAARLFTATTVQHLRVESNLFILTDIDVPTDGTWGVRERRSRPMGRVQRFLLSDLTTLDDCGREQRGSL